MICTEVRECLSEFVDRDLTSEVDDAVRVHLAGCEACERELEGLRQLVALAAGNNLAIEPDRDLWPEIQSSVERPWYAAYLPTFGGGALTARGAALIAACLVIGMVSILWRVWPGAGPDQTESGQIVREVSVDYGASSELAHSEDGTLRTRRDLVTAVERLPEDLPVPTRTAVVEAQAAIENAVGEIRVALESDPGNAELQHLLAARYRQEVSFLKQVSRL